MTMFKSIVAVGIGGALGSMTRYLMILVFKSILTSTLNLGVLLSNVIGCFLIGLIVSLTQDSLSSVVKYGMLIGFLGGFTTFSSFAIEGIQALEMGQSWKQFALIVMLHNGLGIFACWLGFSLLSR